MTENTKKYEQRKDYTESVHNFFAQIKEENISDIQKKHLKDIIQNIENATDKQKRRFISYYCTKDRITLENIAQKEKCRATAVRESIVSIVHKLVRLEDDKKERLINLFNECNEK